MLKHHCGAVLTTYTIMAPLLVGTQSLTEEDDCVVRTGPIAATQTFQLGRRLDEGDTLDQVSIYCPTCGQYEPYTAFKRSASCYLCGAVEDDLLLNTAFEFTYCADCTESVERNWQ